jgi:hypothetical protein
VKAVGDEEVVFRAGEDVDDGIAETEDVEAGRCHGNSG